METPGHRPFPLFFRIAFALPVLLLFAPPPLLSQMNCIELTRAGDVAVSSPPGRIVTAGIVVVNRSGGDRRLETRLSLPSDWRNLTPDVPFTLAGFRSDIRLLSMAVPASAPSGVYHVRYSVSDNAVPPCRSELAFDVVVEPMRRIDLELRDAPRYVISGSSCSATFLLRNQGNEESLIRLGVRGGGSLTAVPESAAVTLKPQESRLIAVIVSADPGADENSKEVVELRAVLGRDSTVAVHASCLLEIVPRVTAGDIRFHEIPLDVKLRAAGESGQAGGQIEVAGGGTITDKGTDRVDLLLRTPDTQARSILGLRDEYRLSYLSENYQVALGDRAYELTPLTELARYAFGAGGRVTSGDVTAGGFVNQTRYFFPLQREQAGFVNYGFAPGTTVGVNYLRKEDYNVSNVATVRGTIRPVGGTDVELEYGMSDLDGAHDDAYAARVLGSQQWVSYDLRLVHAGPEYGGYYRNVDFGSASVNAQPWGSLRLEAFYQEERQNLLDDTLQLVAPRDRYIQAGAGWGELLAVYYRQIDQRDMVPVPKYDRRESSIQLRSGYSFPAANIYASVDLGTSREYQLQNAGPLRRYQLSANFRPEVHQSYGFTAEYLREQNLYSGEQMETWSGSLNAAIALAARTRLLGTLYGTRVASPFVQTYSFADLSLEYEFPFRHTLTVRGRQSMFTPSIEGKQVAFLVEYAIPLSIPVTHLTGAGVLRGMVKDEATGAGLKDVVLYAGGATAVTDESGEYFFPSLRPDVYALQVDLASAGVDRVTTRPAPFLVTVLGGEESRLDIGVIPSATVAGAFTVYDFRDQGSADSTGGELVEQGKGANVLVELTGREGTFRRVSDNRGRFQFADLRPGEWVLHISAEGLPEYHYPERDSIRFLVIPRGRVDTALRILPKRRRIQILQEGTVRQGWEPGVVKPPPVRPKPHRPQPKPVPKATDRRSHSSRILRGPAGDTVHVQFADGRAGIKACRGFDLVSLN